jgi:plasmid stabilization system protein ParE
VDYRVVYSQRALADLSEIVQYIAVDDGEAASKYGGGLLDHVDLLVRFPRVGSLVSQRRRVRKVVHSPILIYYRVYERRRVIEVLHFRHGSRRCNLTLQLRSSILANR